MVVLLECSPSSTEELWSELWTPPRPRSYFPIAQFGRAASSRMSLGGSKLLPFKNDGGHRVLGTFNVAEMF